MVTPGSHAATVLFSTNQQRLLRALFSDLAPPEGYPYAELLRLTNAGAGGLHRELKQFEAAGLVRLRLVGGRRFYSANPEHPIHEELRSIARKLLGIPSVVSEAIGPMREDIEEAFIYGSIAKQTETAESDIDVIVVGDCDYARLLGALQPLDTLLRRHVSVRLYAPDEYRRLVRSDSFLKKVDQGPKVPLIEKPGRRAAPDSARALHP